MKTELIELLKIIETEIPPPPNCHHVLSCAKYGSDERGWEDKLCLQINFDGEFYQFFLDESDLTNPPQQLADTISLLLKDIPANTQRGKGPGQFV